METYTTCILKFKSLFLYDLQCLSEQIKQIKEFKYLKDEVNYWEILTYLEEISLSVKNYNKIFKNLNIPFFKDFTIKPNNVERVKIS